MDAEIDRLKRILRDSNNVVFFGGAGVSTESGIPDFRSATGIYKSSYEKYPPEVILSNSFFVNNTELFFDFYKDKIIFEDAKPNKAHYALAELERMGKLKGIVTQNIDGLHQKASSNNVVELHGSIHRNYCISCNKFYELSYITKSSGIPRCSCNGIIKPDVVLYEELLKDEDIIKATEIIGKAETLIVAGTSLNVFPAAGLLQYFRGENIVMVNLTYTNEDMRADLIIRGRVGEILGAVVDRLKKEGMNETK